MRNQIHFSTISELAKYMDLSVKHPLVLVVDFTTINIKLKPETKISTDFYAVFFKNYCPNKIRYGRQLCDFEEGSLFCVSPKQVLYIVEEAEEENRPNKMGWGLFFHPDLIRKSALWQTIKKYTFFSYDISEALHLSEKEKQSLKDCIDKIEIEINENIDSYSQNLIISNIELLLNYCLRYYGRQFITRNINNSIIVSNVEKYLNQYIQSDRLKDEGLLTVNELARNVNLSSNYISDLLKKEIGMTAIEYIHYRIIEEAKSILMSKNSSISEIAYSLGFEYPQYFSRLFKQKTGHTPLEYRNLN